jgi:hypothetical protein
MRIAVRGLRMIAFTIHITLYSTVIVLFIRSVI